MERETFINEDVAKVLNENFICIKVDREERPDIDHIYMTALSRSGGRGGWPLSMFLTPDGKPIVGGTIGRRAKGQGHRRREVTRLRLAAHKIVRDAWAKDDAMAIEKQAAKLSDGDFAGPGHRARASRSVKPRQQAGSRSIVDELKKEEFDPGSTAASAIPIASSGARSSRRRRSSSWSFKSPAQTTTRPCWTW